MAEEPNPPGERAQGSAKLALYIDPEDGQCVLSATAGWWTPDGTIRESALQLQGDIEDTYDLLTESTRWIWSRWKKPIKLVGSPFDA